MTTSYNDSRVMYREPADYVAKLRTLKDRAFEVARMLRQVGITK